jgi:hypothetical protein
MMITTSLGDANSSRARKLLHDCSSVHAATRVHMMSPPTNLHDITSIDKGAYLNGKSISHSSLGSPKFENALPHVNKEWEHQRSCSPTSHGPTMAWSMHTLGSRIPQ